MLHSYDVFCFNQAEFTPEDLHSRKRVLNLEVCIFFNIYPVILIILIACVHKSLPG